MIITEEIKSSFSKLGIKIKQLRENKGLTLSEFSKITGINKRYLQKIEKGNAYGVSIERHLLKITEALEIPFCDIFKY